jgi:lipopolysaccharide transport system ATP-binding protein
LESFRFRLSAFRFSLVSDSIISVENLSKKYRLRHQTGERYTTLRDTLAAKAKSLFGRSGSQPSTLNPRPSSEDFWALKGVSFDVKQGEVVGIIGRNGAGKSTLLKILSRITEPTEGRVTLRGRVASLLEVGTGFHPELTGRENIFLNGAILGMSRAEIRKKFDEIVAFAEVEKFLDTPVKRYSSGMYVRLAFAVAAHLEPEILIVDEVLAVGDQQFQKKCLGRMGEVARGGRTVLFVSHNMTAVMALCRRSLLLDSGGLLFDGEVTRATDLYSSSGHMDEISCSWHNSDKSGKPIGFRTISAMLTGQQPTLRLKCELDIRCLEACPDSFIAVDILNSSMTPIMQALPKPHPFIRGKEGEHRVDLEIDLPPLIPGIYFTDFWLGAHNTTTFHYVRQATQFEVVESPTPSRSFPHTSDHGAIVPICRAVYSSTFSEKAA